MDGALFLDEVVHDHMTEATRLLQPVRAACGGDCLASDALQVALERIGRLPAPIRARIDAEAGR